MIFYRVEVERRKIESDYDLVEYEVEIYFFDELCLYGCFCGVLLDVVIDYVVFLENVEKIEEDVVYWK